jgi:hypothetical protein
MKRRVEGFSYGNYFLRPRNSSLCLRKVTVSDEKKYTGLYRNEDVRRNLVSAFGNAHLKAAPPTVIGWPGTLPV